MLGSQFFKKLAVVIGIGGFAIGILLGAVIKTVPLYEYDDPAFNTALMFYSWLVAAILIIGCVALVFHFRNQEAIIDNLYEIGMEIKGGEKKN